MEAIGLRQDNDTIWCPWPDNDEPIELNDDRCQMPDKIGWLLSIDMSFTELVMVLIVCRVVLLKCDMSTATNKLAFLPLYFLLVSCIFGLS